MIAIATGTNILVRIRPVPKTVAEKREQKKPKLTYNVMTKKNGGAPAPTRSAQSGLRKRNVAGSSNQVAAEPGDKDSEAPRAKEDNKVPVVGAPSESPIGQDGGDTTPAEDTKTPVVTTSESPVKQDGARDDDDKVPVVGAPNESPVGQDGGDTTPAEDTNTPVVKTSESPVKQDGARDDDAAPLATDEDIGTAATPDSATGGNESVA